MIWSETNWVSSKFHKILRLIVFFETGGVLYRQSLDKVLDGKFNRSYAQAKVPDQIEISSDQTIHDQTNVRLNWEAHEIFWVQSALESTSDRPKKSAGKLLPPTRTLQFLVLEKCSISL